MNMILANAGSIICIIAAAYLAAHDKDSWGWFLLVALLTSHIVKSN